MELSVYTGGTKQLDRVICLHRGKTGSKTNIDRTVCLYIKLKTVAQKSVFSSLAGAQIPYSKQILYNIYNPFPKICLKSTQCNFYCLFLCFLWCLTPFSTVFQLYRGGQSTYPCFPGVLLTCTPHNNLSKPLATFPRNHCRNNGHQ